MQQVLDQVYVRTLTCGSFSPPASSVGNTAIKAGSAGDYLDPSKSGHQHEPALDLNGSSTATAAAVRRILHVVRGATATLVEFGVGAVTAATGNATATLDLKKNGSSILTATITLDNGAAAFEVVNPSGYSSTSLVQGDVLEAQITAVNAGTGALPAGVFAFATVREDPA